MIIDLFPGISSGYYYGIYSTIVINERLYFRANDGVNGANLWSSDGTEAGTRLVKDFKEPTHSNTQFNVFKFKETLHIDVYLIQSITSLYDRNIVSLDIETDIYL